ncbi:MAG: hypothetical protein M1830_003600 [Pleopsidium flavum]|nr:MAG: hypothetical protein M1830_003600 [Pleopsidium flavum]
MPPKVATQAITVPINEYSDGDVSHRPVQPPYTPCEPDLYLGKLAKKWMGDTGMAEQDQYPS